MYNDEDFYDDYEGWWDDPEASEPDYCSDEELWELVDEIVDEYSRYNNDLDPEVVFKAVKMADDGFSDGWGIQSEAVGYLVDWGLVPPEGEEPR